MWFIYKNRASGLRDNFTLYGQRFICVCRSDANRFIFAVEGVSICYFLIGGGLKCEMLWIVFDCEMHLCCIYCDKYLSEILRVLLLVLCRMSVTCA